MPAVLTSQRVDSVAVRVGHLALIRQRVQPAAGIGRAGGITAAALIVVLAVLLRDAGRFFLGQSSVIGGFGLGDLAGERGLVRHILHVVGVHFFIRRQHLGQERILLRALALQLLLLLGKLFADRVKLCQLLLQLLTLGGDLVGDGLHLLEHQLVGLGDLLNDVDLVKKIGEAVCTKQDAPVGDTARLLHGADTGLILLIETLLLGLGGFEVGLLVGDEQAVLLHLLVEVVDGRLRHADLLIDVGFLVDKRLGLGFVFIDLRLQGVTLFFQLRLLIAQAVQFFFDLGAGRCVDHDDQGAGNKAQQHHGGEHQTDDTAAGAALFLFHKLGYLPVYTFRNFRMESKLPNTPTRKPVSA